MREFLDHISNENTETGALFMGLLASLDAETVPDLQEINDEIGGDRDHYVASTGFLFERLREFVDRGGKASFGLRFCQP
mgnify:FL=1